MKFRILRKGLSALVLFVGITAILNLPGFVRCSGEVDSQANRTEYNSMI
ncbi:MAG TPA: hypothetical protein VHT73_13465 [Thermodesulfobacteriota bacterium]|nr:hypothetical protein [Thermodesulfobacteriota bacterium]